MTGISRVRDALAVRRDPVAFARSLGVRVGQDCRFLAVNRAMFGSEPYLIEIGDHVTLTTGVTFATHDGGVWVLRRSFPDLDVFGPIRIGSNVFVGLNALILPGVTIGDNVVIGAGSVVARDVPSNSVAAGNPCRVLRSLDEYELRSLERGTHIRHLPPQEKRQRLAPLPVLTHADTHPGKRVYDS